MKQPDRQRARRLLTLRQKGPQFRWHYLLRSTTLRLTVVAVAFACAVAVFAPHEAYVNRMTFLFVGILLGRLARDAMWLKDVVDGYPFLERVLDWKRVEQMAAVGDNELSSDTSTSPAGEQQ
ncbi:MAG: hypothetical protein AAGB13_16305 [Cyanobacteria bacterium P01_F01_bin.33]